MGPEFFQTRLGVRFYEHTAPKIAEELARLNTNLEALIAVLRDRPSAPASEPAIAPPGNAKQE